MHNLKLAAVGLVAVGLLAVMARVSPADTAIINMTVAGTDPITGTAATGGSFIVSQDSTQSTGTGVIDSFLRINQTGSEAGYNSGSGSPLDVNGNGHNVAFQLGNLQSVMVGTTSYYQFALDANQVTSKPYLSLNQMQIFASSAPLVNYTTYTAATASSEAVISFSGATLLFQLSDQNIATGVTNEIQINYALNNGSGSGDIYVYVPTADFVGVLNTSYITLFSQFGAPPGAYASNDGFEEWYTLGNVSFGPNIDTPVPSSFVMAGSLLVPALGFFWFRRRKTAVAA